MTENMEIMENNHQPTGTLEQMGGINVMVGGGCTLKPRYFMKFFVKSSFFCLKWIITYQNLVFYSTASGIRGHA